MFFISAVFDYLKRFVLVAAVILGVVGFSDETATVELYANNSSGYAWECGFDKPGVLALKESYYEPDASSVLAESSGGDRYFVLKAVGYGVVNITFEYVKYFGKDRAIASKYIYTYDVSPDGDITLKNVERRR